MRPWLLALLLYSVLVRAGEPERLLEGVHESVVTVTVLDERGEIYGEGSGVVTAAGKIITNCHVVQEAVAIRVSAGGRDLSATIDLEDTPRDLCLLSVPELKVPAVKVRKYADLRAGETVYAVGNPLGFGLAASAGLISFLGRDDGEPRIYTSAAISPGSSGGGLFDAEGRLIGITTAVLSSAQNFNMALPADWIAELSKRGIPPPAAAIPVAPDPEWLSQAEVLRTSAQWMALAEWARRWRESYPVSADAGYYLGLALLKLDKPQEAKDALLAALQDDPRHALAHMMLGQALRDLGDKPAALEELKRAQALQPSLGYFHRVAADWQREDNRIDEALSSIQEAVKFAPWDDGNWEILGELLHLQGDYQDAVKAYRTVLWLKPEPATEAGAKDNLALALVQLGDTDAARQTLNSIPAGHTARAATWVNLGATEGGKGRHADALQAFRKALEIDPADGNAWYNLAHVLIGANRMAEGVDALHQAVKHQPGFVLAWIELGDVLDQRGDYPEAAEAYQKATAADSSSAWAWYRLGMARRSMGDLAGTLAALRTAAVLDPANKDILGYLGEAQIRTGHVDEALASLQAAEKLDPRDEVVLQTLTMYYGMKGDSGQVLVYADRALESNPASPNAWSNKGYALLQLRRFPEAIQALETATRLQPDFANAWINLGQANLQHHQLGKAITALEQALKLSPNALDARLYLAQAYLASTQYIKARQHLDVLLDKAPDLPAAWYSLAALHAAQGNRREALAAYAKLKSLNAPMAQKFREWNRKVGDSSLIIDFPE